jgi:hypothetical protein
VKKLFFDSKLVKTARKKQKLKNVSGIVFFSKIKDYDSEINKVQTIGAKWVFLLNLKNKSFLLSIISNTIANEHMEPFCVPKVLVVFVPFCPSTFYFFFHV